MKFKSLFQAFFLLVLTISTLGTARQVNAKVNLPDTVGTSKNFQVQKPASAFAPDREDLSFFMIIVFLLILSAGGAITAIYLLKKPEPEKKPIAVSDHIAIVDMQQGSMAGQQIQLTKLPCRIGRSPFNEICINDPNVRDEHIRIFINNDSFYLMDLGGETFVNDTVLRKSSAPLKSGDKVRLGQGVLFVFGY